MKKLLSGILVLLMMLGICAFAEDEIAVSVGNRSFTVEEVQKALNNSIALYESTGELTEAVKKALTDSVIEDFVQRGLVETACAELGIASMTEAQFSILHEMAQEQFEGLRQEARDQYTTEDLSDSELDELLTEAGITPDALFDELVLEVKRQRLLDNYDITFTVEDEALEKFYEENYAAPYRKRYADNIPLYEEEVLYGEAESFYFPEGYRQIRQIILDIPEAQSDKLNALTAEAEALLTEARKAYTDAADMVIAGKDPEEARQRYQAAEAAFELLQADYKNAAAEIIPAMADLTDEIYARLDAGERFTSLISDYSVEEDAAYRWHAESEYWDGELDEAVRTLDQPGDISQPVLCDGKLHILYYEKDVPTGTAALSTEDREMVRAAAENLRQKKKLNEVLEKYRDVLKIETYPELLK